MPKAVKIIICVLLALALVWVLVSYGPNYWRPMFSNVYAKNDREIIPHWRYMPSDFEDLTGNLILVDEQLNLVLVVLQPDQQEAVDYNKAFKKTLPIVTSIRNSATRSGISFRTAPDAPVIKIQRCSNQLIIVLPDQTIRRAEFKHQQARRRFGNTGNAEAWERERHNILCFVQNHFSTDEPEVIRLVEEVNQIMQKRKNATEESL